MPKPTRTPRKQPAAVEAVPSKAAPRMAWPDTDPRGECLVCYRLASFPTAEWDDAAEKVPTPLPDGLGFVNANGETVELANEVYHKGRGVTFVHDKDARAKCHAGFHPHTWLTKAMAKAWQSFHYPLCPNRESVAQWVAWEEELAAHQHFGKSGGDAHRAEDEAIAKLRADVQLVREFDADIVARPPVVDGKLPSTTGGLATLD